MELSWVLLYCNTIILGSYTDNVDNLSFSFILLVLAALEISIGFILIHIFKNFNYSINFCILLTKFKISLI